MQWGEVIRRLREDKGLNQTNLGEMIGVDKATIVRWERDGKIKTQYLEKIAKALGIELNKLYAIHSNPDILNEPVSSYKIKDQISVMVTLDGSLSNLEEWMLKLKKLNAALN
ncbi:MAG: helix-turn-helix domain-containing protein [Chryseotalea sp.]|jgi:transcriptional regulator with XRE-family HTH domain